MTPEEHFRDAERLVADALDPTISGLSDWERTTMVAAAQVHATLALFAAQRTPVDPTRSPDPELCAGPVQTPGVEGWSCGRGLSLATSKEQSNA